MKKLSLLSCFLSLAGTLTGQESDYRATYSEAFQDRYPVIDEKLNLEAFELEAPVVIENETKSRKATVVRSKGDKYPYEDQICLIKIESKSTVEPRNISFEGFRNVDVTWISEKLLLINIGIGRLAGIQAIFDSEKNEWIYRESVQHTGLINQTIRAD